MSDDRGAPWQRVRALGERVLELAAELEAEATAGGSRAPQLPAWAEPGNDLVARVVRLFAVARERFYRSDAEIAEYCASVAAGDEAYQEYRRRVDYSTAQDRAHEVMLRHYLAREARR